MRTKVITLATGVLLLMLWATPVHAQEIPPLPHAFYGTVEVNDGPASSGTEVEARGEGIRTDIQGNPIVTTAAGVYGSPDPMGPKLIVQGDLLDGATITFYINGVSTEQTAEWHSGQVTELDLTVTIPTPPPTPPPGGGGGPMPPDTIPPRISEVSVINITETSVDIIWRTHEKSNSQVEYWSSPGNFSPLDTERVIEHLVHLADLTPASTYHYRVMSADRADNLTVTDEYTFTTLGEVPAAVFTSSNLSISPSEVNIGETVTISVLITNAGDAAGSYEVTLKINGVVEATKEATLGPGTSQEVTFSTARDVAGSYTVDVNGHSGSFTVKEKPAPPTPPVTPAPPAAPPPAEALNWPVIWGITGGVIAGLVIYWVVRRKKRV